MKTAAIIFSIFANLLGSLYAQVAQEWEARFNGWGNGIDWAHSITVDDFGNVYVAGQTMGNNGTDMDFATIKYNSSGVQQWVKRYNGPGNLTDKAWFIALDDSGNVYVAGQSWGSEEIMYDYTIIKYTTSGSQKWVSRYNGPGNEYDEVTSLALDDSCNVYVTGRSWGITSSGNLYGYATIKYNSSGSLKWVARYDGGWNEAHSLAIDDSGYVFVTGFTGNQGTASDYLTIKYNSSGIEQWSKIYNGPDSLHDEANSIEVDDSGNVYVTGWSYANITNNDFLTIKYNSSGIQQWIAKYNGPGNSVDIARCVRVDDFGNVYVLGHSIGIGTSWYDYATIKYDSDGIQQWVARYNGPGNDQDSEVYSLTLDDSCNVYVTGRSVGSGTGLDYATVKYNPTGIEQWVQRYNGTGNSRDEACSLALDVLGNVYVTGWSVGSGTDFDYVTIKYSQNPTGVQPIFSELPTTYQLYQNFPNPFNPSTVITYQLPVDGNVTLKVYDILGREIASVVNEEKPAGTYEVDFNAINLASGVYIYTLIVDGVSYSKSMILLR